MHAARANASALAKQSGVKVVWERGFAPRCDRKLQTIYLPSPEGLKGIFEESDAADVIYGLMVHEIGHENFTDRNMFGEGMANGELIRTCHNVLEDIYIEKAIGARMPGLALSLQALTAAAEKAKLWSLDGKSDPVTRLMIGLMLTLRSEVIGQTLVTAADAEAAMAKELGPLWDQIKAIALDATAKCSSQANGEAAVEIINLIAEAAEDPEDEPGDSDDSDEDGESGESGESGDDSDDKSQGGGSGSGDESDESGDESQGSGSGSGDESDESGDESQSSGSGSEGDDSGDASNGKSKGKPKGAAGSDQFGGSNQSGVNEQGNQFCKDVLEAGLKNKVFSGEVADLVEQTFEEQRVPRAEEMRGSVTMQEMCDQVGSSKAETHASLLAARIDQLLWAKTQAPAGRRMSGTKIDRRGLTQSRFNPNIFKSRVVDDNEDTAVTVMVDVSGSTFCNDNHGVPILASMLDAGLSVIRACEPYDGVATSLVVFDDAYKVVKTFDQDSFHMMNEKVACGGNTHTSSFMPVMLEEIASRNEARKLIILITDGAVGDRSDFNEAIEFHARNADVEVRALMFSARQVDPKDFLGDIPASWVSSSEQVVDCIYDMLEQTL